MDLSERTAVIEDLFAMFRLPSSARVVKPVVKETLCMDTGQFLKAVNSLKNMSELPRNISKEIKRHRIISMQSKHEILKNDDLAASPGVTGAYLRLITKSLAVFNKRRQEYDQFWQAVNEMWGNCKVDGQRYQAIKDGEKMLECANIARKNERRTVYN